MNKIINDILTEKDNVTHDSVGWLSCLSVVAGIVLQIYCTLKGIPFDAQAYGIGSAAIIGSLGFSK